MDRDNVADLIAFITVAQDRSFTRAAARLGVSQSALSHALRRLEKRLGVRLLTRSTRSVSPTDAGERLLATVEPRFREVDAALEQVSEFRDKPAGTIRLSAGEHAINSVLWPRLQDFTKSYPDIQLEIIAENGFVDIVAQRYDAGVRLGEQLAKDMIAVRIGPDWRMAVVGSPDYFEGRTLPSSPHDLTEHVCINLRLPTYGGNYAWEFEHGGRRLNVRVDGQLTFSSSHHMLSAALVGSGLACIPEDMVMPHVEAGELVRVLGDWMPIFDGYHLYYPSRRQTSPAFARLIEALRFRLA
ncbi:LysR family transcriptional regulator [Kaistia dalseonensis]|uniref:DNA-binding transcriptional LysR family regulator n=1 Tax=Kaistia dalseonensis TaxID=410840 RepID=A0ABU0H7Q6_9HYPH|nr:LysR family transcriptional regulator [Kaistia dalseonensis]MCX5495742.1 LysR family transcriptional regulator [Kaistia dalseonensis]MDQ0438339.1 DNA-binding transcriptional LysR family regulator [Kaistia dalseonensis]